MASTRIESSLVVERRQLRPKVRVAGRGRSRFYADQSRRASRGVGEDTSKAYGPKAGFGYITGELHVDSVRGPHLSTLCLDERRMQ